MDEILVYLLLALVIAMLILAVLAFRIYSSVKNNKTSDNNLINLQIQRLDSLEQRLNQTVHHNLQSTNVAFNEVLKHVSKLEHQQIKIDDVSKNLLNLQNLLYDKKTRGIFGEVELYQLLNNIFGENHKLYQKQYSLANGTIVDCAIFTDDKNTIIPIDAKFPLENFNRLHSYKEDSLEYSTYRKEFKKDVIKHINDIANKYIIDYKTTPIAFMFVPSESIVNYLYDSNEDVIQYGYQKKVFIVSFSTLIAYLTTLKSILMDNERNLKAKEIQIEYHKLAIEMNRFIDRYYIILKDFDRISQDIRNTDITIQKLAQKFKRIQEVDLDDQD